MSKIIGKLGEATVLLQAGALSMAVATISLWTTVHSGRPDFFSGAPHEAWLNPQGYTAIQNVGILVFLFFSPLAMAFFGIGLLVFLRDFRHSKGLLALVLLLALGALIFAFFVGLGSFAGAGNLWICGYIACWALGPSTVDPSGFQEAAGSHVFLLGLAAVALFVMMGLRSQAAPHVIQVPKDCHNRFVQRRRLSAFCLLIALPLWTIFICGLLPNSHHTLSRYGKGGKPPSKVTKFAITKDGAGVSEVEDAFMTTLNVELGGRIFAKMFPDTLIFYAFLETLLFAGLLCTEVKALGRLAAKPVLKGATVSQIFLAGSLVVFYSLFTLYWAHDHMYSGGKASKNTRLEVWARAAGMDAAATLGLLLLPAARTSPLLKAAGLSFESSLYMHIWLGVLFLVFSILHTLLFFARFVEFGQWQNILPFSLGTYRKDNFTIGLMAAVFWPSLITFGVLPALRRKCWELFKLAHYMFLVLVPATIIHGSSSWYFVVPGVLLWVADAILRFGQAAEKVELEGACTHGIGDGDITELRIRWPGSSRLHSPGMFCWINCPQLSQVEWHPFSLSSSPADEIQSFHIKNMDEPGRSATTWTGRLHGLVDSLSASGEPLHVNIDGPYGPLVNFDAKCVVLVAGGIGITAMQNLLRSLLQGCPGVEHVQRAHLVWVVRSREMVDLFASNFDIAHAKESISVQFSIYCSRAVEVGECALGALQPGRPDLGSLLQAEMNLGERVVVRACGPEQMVQSCSKAVSGLKHQQRSLVNYEPWSFVM
eukprot:TRINITY_DN1980_c0_g2_i1.p1 TRINITY_DN1980_c0_g2~~TRINITY_DN1980_c0_g2_i1.p1  ORF type:complete len:767 (+),score=132.01 TRINITY_DN1980_c0_g2_i1:65-2365(+)